MLALIGSAFFATTIQQFALRAVPDQFAAVISAVLVDLTNIDRQMQNVGGLTINETLVAAAKAKANDMAAKSYFAHVSPEGLDSWHWFKEAGYTFNYAGENLAVDFGDSADVARAWMNSPTHRRNVLDPHFTEIGIATAEGVYQGHPTTFVVQMFGTPSQGKVAAQQPIIEESTPSVPTEIATASAPEPAVLVLGETTVEKETVPAAARAEIENAPTQLPVVAREVPRYAPAWGFLASSPKTLLRYTYYVLASLVVISLLIATGIEFKRHHRGKFVVAGGLVFLMIGFFVAADYLVFSEPVIAETLDVVRLR